MSFADKIKQMVGVAPSKTTAQAAAVSTPSVIDGDEVLRIAKAVARRYANRCWWADVDDMTSEASLAVLTAKKTWDPEVGIPFDGYAARAAALHLRTYLWRESSPVTGGIHDPQKNIAGVHSGEFDEELHSSQHTADPGQRLDEAHWRLKVRRRIRALARDGRDGELAAEVLVRGRRPRDVIAETGKDVHGAVHLVRRKIREDRRMHKLWTQNGGRNG